MASRLNHRSPAVKRILQEIKEMRELMDASPATPFAAEPLESDIFQWQFVIKGAPSTEFENGIYHGRIILPPDYPFKPPSFIMLTPSGRFETHTKICLSISSFHEESWQPSWSMRTALTALIAFFPTSGKGAVGSMDSPKAERLQMAQESRNKIPQASSAEKQEVMKRLHDFLLAQDSLDNAPACVCGPVTPEPERSSTTSQAASVGATDLCTDQRELNSHTPDCADEDRNGQSESAPAPIAPAPTAQCSTPAAASTTAAVQSTDKQILLGKCIKALDTILLSLFMVLGVIAAWRCTR